MSIIIEYELINSGRFMSFVFGAIVSIVKISVRSEMPSLPASSYVKTLNSYIPSIGILKPTHFARVFSSILIHIGP